MKITNIDKVELLNILKSNREKHITAHAEAVEDRKALFEKTMKLVMKEYRATGKIKQSLSFPKVPLNIEQYDKAIRKMELETNSIVELDDHEFDQLVMDNWHWKDEFELRSTMYKGGL